MANRDYFCKCTHFFSKQEILDGILPSSIKCPIDKQCPARIFVINSVMQHAYLDSPYGLNDCVDLAHFMRFFQDKSEENKLMKLTSYLSNQL